MSKSIYVCKECEHTESKWMGKCHQCQTWNSFEIKTSKTNKSTQDNKVYRITDIFPDIQHIKTKWKEFNRAYGGGLSRGSINLIGGQPGVGKSTLALSILESIISDMETGLYLSGEESVSQIQTRCQRLKIKTHNLFIAFENEWEVIKKIIKKEKPSFLIIDSVQTLKSMELMKSIGGSSNIKDIVYELVEFIKPLRTTVILIGHVTKAGELAGPKFLEHMVDTVASLDKNSDSQLRVLRVYKNRFGDTSEVGLLRMTEKGLIEANCHSLDSLRENGIYTLGRIGSRNHIFEVQSLIGHSGEKRKIAEGYSGQRLLLILAIIKRYLPSLSRVDMSELDIYLSFLDSISIYNRVNDLGVICSLLYSFQKVKITQRLLVVGEVDLRGNIRELPDNINLGRSYENIDKIILPHNNAEKLNRQKKTQGITYIGVKNISDFSTLIA